MDDEAGRDRVWPDADVRTGHDAAFGGPRGDDAAFGGPRGDDAPDGPVPQDARAGPVLLVEDETVLRDALADALRRRGVETIDVGSAEEAVERLAAGLRPGLVFLDLNLPGASGWDLLRGELAPSAARPPVVLLTAISVDPARLQQYAVDGYLPKPFALATFLATARRFLTGASGVAS